MDKIITLLVAASLISAGAMAQTATVNLNTERQLIKGFGGMNHPLWIGDLTAAQRETAFGNGPGQLGMTIVRIFISDNPTQWQREVATAKRAQEMGAIVFASPWNPPANMIERFTRNGVENQKRLNHSMYADYVKHLNDFIDFMTENGVDLYAVSIQNEPDYGGHYDDGWAWWSPAEILNFMKNYAGGIKSRVMAPESFQYRKDVSDVILNDPAALANMDILGAHLYGTSVANMAYPLFEQKGQGKELWMTEVYHPNSEANSADRWPEALQTGHHIHNALAEGNFQTYVWWYIRRQYSPMKEDGTISKRGYMMCHYSKFVRPGYVRVDATKTPAADVHLSAYKNGDDVAIVVVNRSTSARTITISVPNTKVRTWERYVTTSTKNLEKAANINAAGTSFQVTLEAESMTTFDGKNITRMPSVKLDMEKSYAAPANIRIASDFSHADPNKSVVNIQYFNGTERIVDKWVNPFVHNWENVDAGTYTIIAVAYDADGNSARDTMIIKVNPPQAPYGGLPHPIPGKIELEHFDIGGNGFAYFDTEPGSRADPHPDFRTDEDVDIEVCKDEGEGYNIGWAAAGEWLEYTVNVAHSGNYDITLRAAVNGTDRRVSLSASGQAIAEDITIPNTGGWQIWQDVTVPNIRLEAGVQVLRLTIGGADYVNLNYIEITETPVPPRNIKLRAGWNIIGCPVAGSTDIDKVLSSIWENVETVKNADSFYNRTQPAYLNTLLKLSYGRGYMVKLSKDSELDWIVR
jgi:O-glycosyl hydrolase